MERVEKYEQVFAVFRDFEDYMSYIGHNYHKSSGKRFISLETETTEGHLLVVELEEINKRPHTAILRYYLRNQVKGVDCLRELMRLIA